MNKPTHPDAVFGPDTSVSYATIAAQIRAMEPRALMQDQLDDVLTLIEYMQQECLRVHEENEKRARELKEWEAGLHKREKELAIRSRAVNAMLKGRNFPRTTIARVAGYLR